MKRASLIAKAANEIGIQIDFVGAYLVKHSLRRYRGFSYRYSQYAEYRLKKDGLQYRLEIKTDGSPEFCLYNGNDLITLQLSQSRMVEDIRALFEDLAVAS